MQTKAPFIKLAAHNPNAEDFAAAAVARWRQLDGALVPIIGRRGMDAIFRHALEMACFDYPWLYQIDKYPFTFDDFIFLQKTFAGQTTKRAAAGNLAFYQCFRELLTSLIGPSLTEGFLQSVVIHPAGHFFQAGLPRLREVNTRQSGG